MENQIWLESKRKKNWISNDQNENDINNEIRALSFTDFIHSSARSIGVCVCLLWKAIKFYLVCCAIALIFCWVCFGWIKIGEWDRDMAETIKYWYWYWYWYRYDTDIVISKMLTSYSCRRKQFTKKQGANTHTHTHTLIKHLSKRINELKYFSACFILNHRVYLVFWALSAFCFHSQKIYMKMNPNEILRNLYLFVWIASKKTKTHAHAHNFFILCFDSSERKKEKK